MEDAPQAEEPRVTGLDKLVRSRDWMYLGPIAAAPMVHIMATLYRSAKPHTRRLLGYGIGVSFGLTVGMRVWMMNHAGGTIPGANVDRKLAKGLVVVTSEEEKRKMESPSAWEVLKQVARGIA